MGIPIGIVVGFPYSEKNLVVGKGADKKEGKTERGELDVGCHFVWVDRARWLGVVGIRAFQFFCSQGFAAAGDLRLLQQRIPFSENWPAKKFFELGELPKPILGFLLLQQKICCRQIIPFIIFVYLRLILWIP